MNTMNVKKCLLLVNIFFAFIIYTNGLPEYLKKVPNSSSFQKALGHVGSDDENNKFGSDLASVNFVWKDVCQVDSDQDGLTNGQELGDPCCKWSSSNDDGILVSGTYSNPGNKTDKTTSSLLLEGCSTTKKTPAPSPLPTPTPKPTPAGSKKTKKSSSYKQDSKSPTSKNDYSPQCS